ncbi:MAG: hypothetical protein ABIO70_32690 [Pseudomonadota bacterium]
MKLSNASLLLPLLVLGACKDDLILADDTGETGDSTPEDTDDTQPHSVWDDQRAETSSTFNGVYASGRGVFVVASGGEFWTFRSATGWTSEALDVEEEELNGIWGVGSDESMIWVAVGDAGKIARSEGGNTTVVDLGTANFETADGSADALTAVGWGGVYAWDGTDWNYQTLPNHERLDDVWVSGSTAIGVGEEGAIVRRQGGTWVAMESPTDQALYGIDGAADTDLWAVGKDGVVLHFDGSVWTEQESFTSQSLWDVYAPSTSSVFVVGNNGVAFHYDGATWQSLPTGVDENLYAVSGSSASDCWAVGNRGTALHYVQ